MKNRFKIGALLLIVMSAMPCIAMQRFAARARDAVISWPVRQTAYKAVRAARLSTAGVSTGIVAFMAGGIYADDYSNPNNKLNFLSKYNANAPFSLAAAYFAAGPIGCTAWGLGLAGGYLYDAYNNRRNAHRLQKIPKLAGDNKFTAEISRVSKGLPQWLHVK